MFTSDRSIGEGGFLEPKIYYLTNFIQPNFGGSLPNFAQFFDLIQINATSNPTFQYAMVSVTASGPNSAVYQSSIIIGGSTSGESIFNPIDNEIIFDVYTQFPPETYNIIAPWGDYQAQGGIFSLFSGTLGTSLYKMSFQTTAVFNKISSDIPCSSVYKIEMSEFTDSLFIATAASTSGIRLLNITQIPADDQKLNYLGSFNDGEMSLL